MGNVQRPAPGGRARPWVLGAVIVLSTVVVDPWGLQAFFVLRLFAASLAVCVGVVLVTRRRPRIPSSAIVGVAAAGFGGALLVASLLSRAPMVAMFGASGRQLGVLAWLMFGVAFVVGASLYERGEAVAMALHLVRAVAVAVIGVAVVALFEVAGRPIVEPSQVFPGRVQASFGNPAVLGAFLALALPILVGGIASRLAPAIVVPALGLGAWLVVASGTRGVWLGLVVAAGAVFGAVRLGGVRPSRHTLAVVGGGLLLVAAATTLTGRWDTVGFGVEGRVATWAVAARVLAADPWVGVGPEGFADAFAEHVDEDFVIAHTRDQVNDRAHAGLLDVALSVGLLGLIPYLVIVAAAVRLALTAVGARGEERPVMLGMATGILAYLVQQQAFFPVAVTDMTFWLVGGLLAAAVGAVRPASRLMAAGVVAIAVVATLYGGLGLAADRMHRTAVGSPPAKGLELLDAAASLRPFDAMHAVLAAALARVDGSPASIDAALSLHDGALRWAPIDGTLILSRSGLLVARFRAAGDEESLATAESILTDLVTRDRTNGEAFLRLGAIRFYVGDFDTAEAYWLRAAALMPHRREPVDNLEVLRAMGG